MNESRRSTTEPSVEHPLILGLLIDVSASMRTLIVGPGAGPGQQRIESVRSSIDQLIERAAAYCTTEAGTAIASRISLFAFGFGFGNPRSYLTGWKGSAVQDLLALPKASEPLIGIDRLASDWRSHQAHITSLGRHMFGATPMLEAFQTAQERLRVAREMKSVADQPILFVFSDGEPTGPGTPDDIAATAQELKDTGVLVACCLLTSTPVGTRRRLHGTIQPDWPPAARLMFACASVLEEYSPYADHLHEHRWQTEPGSRLFAAVTNSEDLSTFLDLALSRLRPTEVATPTPLGTGVPQHSTTQITIHGPVNAIQTAPQAPATSLTSPERLAPTRGGPTENAISDGTFSGPVVQSGTIGQVSFHLPAAPKTDEDGQGDQ
ncbi:vWA domain-containing protein [Streptomyces sp. NBC_01296]|uniref:vWA domain-containing protein n=1 Tax=Streptomyces sp. NBC_01296 TaxID=2903816 RepID=UPI002E0D78F7|nr:vWA domain-containing protein [Streptomyces sp. NBC_01296]